MVPELRKIRLGDFQTSDWEKCDALDWLNLRTNTQFLWVLEHQAQCMSICHWAGSQKLLPWSPRCSQGDLRVDVKDNQCRKRDQRREHTPINSLEGLNTVYKYFSWYTAILFFFSSHIFPVKGKKVHDFLNNFTVLGIWLGKVSAMKIQDTANILFAKVYVTTTSAGWMKYNLYEQQTFR